jgi:hypothetical protein
MSAHVDSATWSFEPFVYPAWAPASLVAMCNDMRAEIIRRSVQDELNSKRYKARLGRTYGVLTDEEFTARMQAYDEQETRLLNELPVEIPWPFDGWQAPLERKLEILHELLTRKDMKVVWDTFRDTPNAASFDAAPDVSEQERDAALAIWNMVQFFIDRNHVDKRPANVKATRLRELAGMIRNVTRKLEDDPTASILTGRAIGAALRQKQVEFCEAHGLDPDMEMDEYLSDHVYFPLQRDEIWLPLLDERLPSVKIVDGQDPEPAKWEEFDDNSQIAFCAHAACSLKLPDVLEHLAVQLENRASREDHLVRLHGSLPGLKLGLVRQLIAYVLFRYAKQFDKEIATIVSIVVGYEVAVDYIAPERRRFAGTMKEPTKNGAVKGHR